MCLRENSSYLQGSDFVPSSKVQVFWIQCIPCYNPCLIRKRRSRELTYIISSPLRPTREVAYTVTYIFDVMQWLKPVIYFANRYTKSFRWYQPFAFRSPKKPFLVVLKLNNIFWLLLLGQQCVLPRKHSPWRHIRCFHFIGCVVSDLQCNCIRYEGAVKAVKNWHVFAWEFLLFTSIWLRAKTYMLWTL